LMGETLYQRGTTALYDMPSFLIQA